MANFALSEIIPCVSHIFNFNRSKHFKNVPIYLFLTSASVLKLMGKETQTVHS